MTSQPQTRESTRVRIGWMDAVRGTAILLLLIWHASAVPVLYGQEMPELVRTVNEFFLPYRMPTLMFLSGMLLPRSISKPAGKYFAGKFAMVLWPYLVWVTIAMVTFLDEGAPWWHWRAWYATSYLWFLFFIAVYYLAAPALRRLPAWAPVAVAAVAGLLLPQGSTEQRLAYFAVFFFAGNWLAQHPDALKLVTHRWAALIAAVPVVLFGVASCIWPEQLQYAVWGAPASIAGTVLLAAIFSHLTRGGEGVRLLQFLGRSSIIYYVSHFPVMAILSIWLAGSIDGMLLALINLVAAAAIGTVLAVFKKRVPIRWLFEDPRPLRHAIERLITRISRSTR
ncbi:acyltransferase [Microbacterium sp. LWH10-1.2]|uniref:acyltransferase n=1 Tax=Microbacterium sp. LWH10-1.2 TaxID=3135255 RepID=UPI003139B2BA